MNTKSNDGGYLPRKFSEEYSDEFRRLNLLTTGLANDQIEREAKAAAFRMAKYGARRSKQVAQELDEHWINRRRHVSQSVRRMSNGERNSGA